MAEVKLHNYGTNVFRGIIGEEADEFRRTVLA